MVNLRMQNSTPQELTPKIIVVGVGGAGGNAVNNMIAEDLEGCEFLVCNTDSQAIQASLAQHKVQLGAQVTGGLGAGSKPEVGREAAEETLDEVMGYLEGMNMAFITAGMGGGTGTGAAPVIAKACREKGILTVGVVTKPFHFEGTHRMNIAEAGIEEMQDYVDTLIVIPNQNLFRVANEKTTFAEAFKQADSVLQSGVRGVTDLMVRPGLVNLDFADIRTAMLEMGKAMMGTGEAEGEDRAMEAAQSAINNPLLDDVSMKGARGVIINVTGGYDMTLFEADEACNRIRDEVDPNANIIFGATFDESMEGRIRVSIVATGIDGESQSVRKRPASSGGAERATPKTVSSGNAGGQENSSAQIATPASALRSGQQGAQQSTSAPATTQQSAFSTKERDSEPMDQDTYSAGEDLPTNTALRGERRHDSFIPPKPVTAESFSSSGASAEAKAQTQSPAIPGAVSGGVKPVGSSLQLNPPKMPQPQEKKRSPSLFERITGAIHPAHPQKEQEEQTQMQGPAPGTGLRAPSRGGSAEPAQGALNIDSPAAKPREEKDSDLDIPAFLRRQAN